MKSSAIDHGSLYQNHTLPGNPAFRHRALSEDNGSLTYLLRSPPPVESLSNAPLASHHPPHSRNPIINSRKVEDADFGQYGGVITAFL
jgi:hypothetical protein